MKAIVYDRFGPASEVLRLVERPDPVPQPGEVRVALRASGVNPSDVKLRAGSRPGGAAPTMPFAEIIPHSDGAGVIEAVGAGVDRARIGERVWIWNGQWERAFGTAAEKIALPSPQAVPLPAEASFAAGACLGIPAVTAWTALFAGGPIAGLDVLVTGGAGAVGRLAVAMARLGGARRIIATVSGPQKAAVAEAAGATHVLDYRRQDVAAGVMAITDGAGVHRVAEVEFGGNLAVSAAVVAPLGWIAAYASMAEPEPRLPVYPLLFKNVTIKLLVVYRLEAALRAGAERDLAAWLGSGALRLEDGPLGFGARYPLSEAASAHERVAAGDRIGPVVLDI